MLAQPVTRARLVAAKAAAVAAAVIAIALAAWAGLIAGVAVGGGGIGVRALGAYSFQLAFFGLAIGAVALALGAGTGRKALAAEVAAGVAIAGWLINGFAPLVAAASWMRYLSPYYYYYYAHADPLTNGVDLDDLVVLGSLTAALTVVAMVTIGRRDLRA